MNVSIIIPNYNGAKLLEKNLPKVLDSIDSYKLGKIELVIPDDASSDNSKEIIEKFIKSVKSEYIVVKAVYSSDRKNGGFSSNVNRGVKVAENEIVVLLNSDVIPHKDFLNYLIPHFKNPEIFAVGCMDESIESGKTVLRGRGIGKWDKGFLMHSAGDLDKKNTLWVSGGSGAFRKLAWDKIFGLNQIYDPFYWEDIDLSYRAQKCGLQTIFEKKSIVRHEHSVGAIASSYSSFKIKKIAYRNQFLFVWQNITDFNFVFSHFFWLPYHLLNAVKSGDRAFLIGFLSALLLLPRAINFRNKMKKIFKKSDEEIIIQYTS